MRVVVEVFPRPKRGHAVALLDCGCSVNAEMTDQWKDQPEKLIGTSKPMHWCLVDRATDEDYREAFRKGHGLEKDWAEDIRRRRLEAEEALAERLGRQKEALEDQCADETIKDERLT